MIERYIYIVLFLIYLILLLVSIWYLLLFTNVPSWVCWLFAMGLILVIIGVFIKEYVYIDYDNWVWIYSILNTIAIILIIIGILYAISFSNMVWYVWIILGVAIILSIIGNMLAALVTCNFMWSVIISSIAFVLYIISLFLLLKSGPLPINIDLTLNNTFFLFPLIGISIIFSVLAVLFEGYAGPPCPCPCDPCSNQCENISIEPVIELDKIEVDIIEINNK